MDSIFYKTNFKFVANRYEEWLKGKCISSGPISTEIVAEVYGDNIHFELNDIGKIQMLKSFDLVILSKDRCVSSNCIQYFLDSNDFNPFLPLACDIYYCGSSIQYVRFVTDDPCWLVEFFGEVVELGQPTSSIRWPNDSDNNREINPEVIDTSFLDICVGQSNYGNYTPSKQQIEIMIDAISHAQNKYEKAAKHYVDSMRGFQIRESLEKFKIPLFYAWHGYRYGWLTDWYEDVDTLFPFMMFEADLIKNTEELIDVLRTQSPFAQIELNSIITSSLILMYKVFIQDIYNARIKL